MARPLRIELAGGLYHVTSRGDRREAIYRSDEDRADWLAVVGHACARFNWRCHAWCQMTNHFHLVLETPDANLGQGMRQLNGVYTQQFNRRHALAGHLFQGRYKAILVERESYLLELARYVVLNPVRAGMVAKPGEWPWSSYLAMVGAIAPPEWLDTDWLLSQFGEPRVRAQAGYESFVAEGVGQPSIWERLRHQILLGSDTFVEQLRTASPSVPRLREVPRAQRRVLARPLAELAATYPLRHGKTLERGHFKTGWRARAAALAGQDSR